MVADRLRDLLRVDQALARRADGELVERLAGLGVMLLRLGEMRAVALVFEQRQQRRERRADVADNAEINGGAAADVFGPDIDLRDADLASLWRIGDRGSRSRASARRRSRAWRSSRTRSR
jgi:hypothetical protein